MDRFIRAAALTGYPELARAVGLDPTRLLAGAGLTLGDLAEQDKWLPAAPVAVLLEVSARRSGCQDFAVRLSDFRRFSTLGLLAVVLREEPTLRGALQLLTHYAYVYNGILDARLIEDPGPATVQVWLEFGRPVPVRQSLDLTAAALAGIVRMLIGAEWQPLAACFSHPAPADLAAFHRVFGPRLRFDQAFTGMTFRPGDLDAPIPVADAGLRPYTRLLLDAAGPPPTASLTDHVRALVEALLPMGRCSLPRISRSLGMHPRTLHRRLAEEGQSFTAIVRSARTTLAERYLVIDQHSLSEIADLLGFAAPSAFAGWFHRQFGMTATQWRRQLRAAAETDDGRDRAPTPTLVPTRDGPR